MTAYDSCLQWKDDNVMALNNYAYYLSEQGKDLHKAESMSYKTIKAEPNNGTYLDTYAWILFMQERYADAKTYIDAALKNRDSTENNSAKTDDNPSTTLDWKIKNKQYISEEEFQKRMNPAVAEVKKQKTTGKATGRKTKRGRKK